MRCYIFTHDDCGRTFNAQEIDCNGAEEALQLGSAPVAGDPVKVWCGPRRLARFEAAGAATAKAGAVGAELEGLLSANAAKSAREQLT